MTLVDLTFLQFQLIALIGADRHRDVSFEDVYEALDAQDLFGWLRRRFASQIDISFYEGDRQAAGTQVEAAINAASEGLRGRERQKTGVENDGICLLLALVTEAIQRR